MSSLNYFRISVITVVYLVILVSLVGVMPIFASPYALQNQVMVNSTTATSGNITSPMNSTSSDAITVTTDKTSYNYGDKITISGRTQDYVTDTPITVIVKSPIGEIVRFDQVNLSSDRTYSWSTTAIGPLWQSAGTYKVVVQYGSIDTISQTTFQLTGQTLSNQSSQSNQLSPPTNLIATSPTSTEIDLSWLAPQNNGGLPITGYKIERNDGNGFNIIANSQTTTYQDMKLSPNSEHAYRVSAINSAGSSAPSNSAPLFTLPSPTTSVQNTSPSTNQNSNQSLNDILQQRYAAARKLQELLNAQTSDPSISLLTNTVIISPGAGVNASVACVITNTCFYPNPLYVLPGTTVTWKNTDLVSHTITSGKVSDNNSGSLFGSGLLSGTRLGAINSPKPSTFSFTFVNVGTYDYFDAVHPWMIGQVIVGSGGQPIPNPQYTPPLDELLKHRMEAAERLQELFHSQNTSIDTPQQQHTSVFTPTQQDIQNINQAKVNQTIAAEVNVGDNQSQTTSIDNNVSVQTTQNTPDSLNVNVSAPSQTGPKVIVFNLNATTINVANLKDLGVMYDGKLIQPAPNMDAILHAKPTDGPSFAIVVTQSGIQVLVLVPHFSTHSITITNISKVITVPEFGSIVVSVLAIAIISIIIVSKTDLRLLSKF